jgi:hypothetical protein
MATLSKSDSLVLSQIFDPESAVSAGPVIDPTLPADRYISDSLLRELSAIEIEAIRKIEAIPSPESIAKDQNARISFLVVAKHLKSLEAIEPTEINTNFYCFRANWNQSDFEEGSARDFHLGGSFGNTISRVMAVHTNPYAKLCGSIVKEAMRNEFNMSVN